MNLFGDEGVGGRKVAFFTCPGEFSRGGLDTHVLVLARVGLVLGRGVSPIGEDVVAESL